MSEIATWSMIRSKIPSFPAPTSGRENECLTKSEILAKGGVRVNGSCGDNECVMINDVTKKDPIVNIIVVSLEKYSGTSVVKATSQYPVSSNITIHVGLRYSPGGSNAELYRDVNIQIGKMSGSNAGSTVYMIITAYFLSVDRDDNYIYQLQII